MSASACVVRDAGMGEVIKKNKRDKSETGKVYTYRDACASPANVAEPCAEARLYECT